MGLDLAIAAFLLLGYLLNEQKHHKASKIIVFTLANLSLFSLAAVVPQGVGAYLLFYPLIVFSIIAFEYKQRFYTYLFALSSLVLNLVLLATGFQPFGSINIQPTDPTISFALNLIISIILISVGIDFLKTLSNKAEKQLVKNQLKTAKLAEELKKKNIDLEKTNKELDQFVYSASHDLKSPLASVSGLLNLIKLESDELPESIVSYHKMMETRIKGLDDFIKDILDYSRNARTKVELSEVNINQVVQDVINHNKYLPNAEKIKSIIKIEIEEPLLLDKTRFFSVLNNLVSNAVKYNDITKSEPYIQILAYLSKDNLVVKVKDSGEGICDECKDYVFDMFYRGTKSSTGSGLGLYITKEMVEKMGGTIKFITQQGSGTEFIFTVPLN